MFLSKDNIIAEPAPMGMNEFFSHPSADGAAPTEDLIFIRGTLQPGMGHDFHFHQNREEFLYILSGSIEQWIGHEKRLCKPGDVIYVPPATVHASFNVGQETAQLLAIFNKKSDPAELATDVSTQAPWNNIRA
ncbi:cupin domain-containing protein [Rubritalea tangerina]|uniref:Cupin domain-containing protein n=1 Tax=Rubritalea tangerina TaxID=430798 RepID=A0ABW4ZDX9_9BACT